MLAITGEARYADVMEQSLYNAILSGVYMSGKGWSYTNPLRWYGSEHELLSNDVHTRLDPGDHQITIFWLERYLINFRGPHHTLQLSSIIF